MGNSTSILGKILVILGPTSSGKSDIAIKLAKKFNGEIISADSRQVYRGMDIGTGKVPRDKRFDLEESRKGSTLRNCERQRVRERLNLEKKVESWTAHGIPHYMLDIVSPRTNYNVAKFKKQAEKIIKDILKRGKLPIICGGTGFWISAIADNINFPEVKPDWKLRKRLEKYSAEKLFSILKKLDPVRARTIDSKNKVRLIRAIEICKKIKQVPSIKNTKHQMPDTRYQTLQIGIKLPKEKLHRNIEKRVKQRFKQGMIKEVKKLRSQGLSWKKIQSFGLAYYWIPLYLQKKLSFGELRAKASKEKSLALEKKLLVEKIIQAEKNYAKRQMTWFRRNKRIKWLKNYKEIVKEAKDFLK